MPFARIHVVLETRNLERRAWRRLIGELPAHDLPVPQSLDRLPHGFRPSQEVRPSDFRGDTRRQYVCHRRPIHRLVKDPAQPLVNCEGVPDDFEGYVPKLRLRDGPNVDAGFDGHGTKVELELDGVRQTELDKKMLDRKMEGKTSTDFRFRTTHYNIFLSCMFLSSMLACWVSASLAGEGPFGIPAPRSPERPGTVILHGGGNGLSDEIRNEFVRLAGGTAARIVLMPSDETQFDDRPVAGESRVEFERRISEPRQYGRWIQLRERGAVADFQFIYRDPERDPNDQRLLEALSQATGVWLPAYDQSWLPNEFAPDYPKASGWLQQALRDVLARGGAVGGLGGGASSLAEIVIEDQTEDDGGWRRAKLRFGLGLLTGVVVDQNFSSHAGRLERLTHLLRFGPRMNRADGLPGVERRTIGLGVDRQTAMILQGTSVRVIGEGQGHLFLKSNGDRTITWRKLSRDDEPIVIETSSRRRVRGRPAANLAPNTHNPWGIPESAKPVDRVPIGRPGTVVLHGGGSTKAMLELFPQLVGTPKPRLVHCPAARESCRPSRDRNGPALAAWLESEFSVWRALVTEGKAGSLDFVTTSNPADANDPQFVQSLRRADGLWFCGGDQRPLAELLVDGQQPTLFQREVHDLVRRGGVVGGSSAGLAIMADVMIEGGDNEDGRPAKAVLSRGLGVVRNVLCEQHFDARGGRIERLTNLLHDHKRLRETSPGCSPQKMIGIAVDESTAAILHADRLRVVGASFAHVFLQSTHAQQTTWHALHPGDEARLVDEGGEAKLVIDDWEIGTGAE